MTDMAEWVDIPDSSTGEVVLRGLWIIEGNERAGILLLHSEAAQRALSGCGGGSYLYWGVGGAGARAEASRHSDSDWAGVGVREPGAQVPAADAGSKLPLVGSVGGLQPDQLEQREERSDRGPASVRESADADYDLRLTGHLLDGLADFTINGTIAHRGTGAADLSPHPECTGQIIDGRWHSQ